MRAFVLSGGGNYGALQVGALDVLLSHGIQPQMLVGVSAGALNAAWVARDPNPASLGQLARIWCQTVPRLLSPPGGLNVLMNLALRRESLCSSDGIQRLVSKLVPAEMHFDSLGGPHLYTVAVRLRDGSLRVFGDNPSDRILDGLMSSIAMPPMFPPWRVGGDEYLDGGILSDLPLQVAIERGATELWALDICPPVEIQPESNPRGVVAISLHSIGLMLDRQVDYEVRVIERQRHIRLHRIRLQSQQDPGFWNFNHAAAMIADGRRAAYRYLQTLEQNQHTLNPIRWLHRLVENIS